MFLSVSLILFITFNFTEGDSNAIDKAEKELTKDQLKEEQKQDSIAIEAISSGKTKDNLLKKYRNSKIEYSKDSIYTKEFIDKNINRNLDPLTRSAL